MKNRPLTAFAFCLLIAGSNALAHDPALHATEDEAKPKPATCQQLNDPQHYMVDLKDPATKALKDRCDARKKAQEQKKASAAPTK